MRFLVPPKSIVQGDGSFTLSDDVTIAGIHAVDRIPALQLIGELSKHGCRARFSTNTTAAEVVVRRDRSVRDPEGYRLNVSESGVSISSSTDAGAYYAIQTLRELIRAERRTIPFVAIEDTPTFARRGFYLDCSRGKVPTVATVKELVERLAAWKINELQLYIENVFTFAKHPRIGEGFSPYTPEDIRAIQEHCRLHHVNLVPSLTSLGHFEKILMLPGYENLGELPGFHGHPGGTTLNPLDPESVALLDDMYDEFLPLFDAEDFNACGDEPWELGQGRSKEKAEKLGVGRVYLDFILELRKLSLARGKRMNMWGDIVLKHPEIIPEIPPEVVLLNWDYSPNGSMMLRTNEFADAGLPLVCCPGTNGWQSHGTRLKMSMRNIHQFAQIAAEHHAEGILNTDWGDGGHRNTLGVSLHGIAYGAACSWNPADVAGPDDDTFTGTFTFHVYGDTKGQVVPVIETIGDDDLGHWAYHAIVESLRESQGLGTGFAQGRAVIDDVSLTDDEIAAKIEKAKALTVHIETQRLPSFEAVALDEMALANRMNHAALVRTRIARRVRAGTPVAPAEANAHATELDSIIADLERLWMIRNRRSRLQDNLDGLRQAMEEAQALDAD